MAQFGGYGFNKSHSAAYALLAYQTAYLKTHYPWNIQRPDDLRVRDTDKIIRTSGTAGRRGYRSSLRT